MLDTTWLPCFRTKFDSRRTADRLREGEIQRLPPMFRRPTSFKERASVFNEVGLFYTEPHTLTRLDGKLLHLGSDNDSDNNAYRQ